MAPSCPRKQPWSVVHSVNICVPCLCQSLWLGHIILPHCGTNNGCLFSGVEENSKGHVEGRKRKRGQLFWSKSWPCSVLKSVVCLWNLVPPGPKSVTISLDSFLQSAKTTCCLPVIPNKSPILEKVCLRCLDRRVLGTKVH